MFNTYCKSLKCMNLATMGRFPLGLWLNRCTFPKSIRKSIPISLYRKCLRSSSVFSSLTSYKLVNIRLFFMDRHWRSRIEFCRVFICPWQLHWLLELSWFANASSWSETFAISDLFLSQSDFKLSNKFPTPCMLFSTSVIFAWQFIMFFFNWNYATA